MRLPRLEECSNSAAMAVSVLSRRVAVVAVAVMMAMTGPAHATPGQASVSPGAAVATCADAFPASADVRAEGWSPEGIERLSDAAREIGSSAFMVVTNGRLVLSTGQVDRNFNGHSLRKSLLSALIGIAEDEGRIDLDASLAQLAIDDTTALTDVEQAATVRQLMGGRSGVYIPASAETPRARSLRPARGSHAPGARWYYNNWDFNVLGEIYQRATGLSPFIAFDERIAKPLCMQDYSPALGEYSYEPAFSRYPAYYFRISARDLARFGQLYLQGGVWEGSRVLPEGWAEASTAPLSETAEAGSKSGYGLMWWTGFPETASAAPRTFTGSGWHGHRLTVIPEWNTVIVNRMNTDDPTAPFFEDNAVWDRILTTAAAARLRP